MAPRLKPTVEGDEFELETVVTNAPHSPSTHPRSPPRAADGGVGAKGGVGGSAADGEVEDPPSSWPLRGASISSLWSEGFEWREERRQRLRSALTPTRLGSRVTTASWRSNSWLSSASRQSDAEEGGVELDSAGEVGKNLKGTKVRSRARGYGQLDNAKPGPQMSARL